MKDEPFIIERTFDAPMDKVWKAITNKENMKQWYFDLAEFKPETGFEFQFTGGPEDRQYLHICRVTEVVPGRRISYSWRYDGYEGVSYVTFELSDDAGKTKLKLTHSGLGSFPAHIKDFARENFVAGWTEIIGTSLENYLHKKE